jgi:hypothetical protein
MAVTREYKPRYQKASKKEKKSLLDEFTNLTGYHRKSAVCLLKAKQINQVMLYIKGNPVKLKPEKNDRPTEKGNVSTQMM